MRVCVVCVNERVVQGSGRITLRNPLKQEQRGPLEAGQCADCEAGLQ